MLLLDLRLGTGKNGKRSQVESATDMKKLTGKQFQRRLQNLLELVLQGTFSTDTENLRHLCLVESVRRILINVF